MHNETIISQNRIGGMAGITIVAKADRLQQPAAITCVYRLGYQIRYVFHALKIGDLFFSIMVYRRSSQLSSQQTLTR